MPKSSYTAILEREGDLYVALCPELDVASQGATVEEATANLKEAVGAFLVRRPPGDQAPAPRGTCSSRGSMLRMGRLRVLSGREVCRILERHGFIEVRRHGSHVAMQRRTTDGTVTVPVPDHPELKIGTLLSIINSGIPLSRVRVLDRQADGAQAISGTRPSRSGDFSRGLASQQAAGRRPGRGL